MTLNATRLALNSSGLCPRNSLRNQNGIREYEFGLLRLLEAVLVKMRTIVVVAQSVFRKKVVFSIGLGHYL